MKVIYGLRRIRGYPRPVVAIGVFDGVHQGHRVILEQAVKKARSIRGTSMVLTFWPHPQKEELLYSLRHRLRLIQELGIDLCVVINFNKEFAALKAGDFIKLLFSRVRMHSLYVGENFRFGRKAEGDYRLLNKFSKLYNFKLKTFKVVSCGARAISSTYIRKLIKKGKLQQAGRLLLRPVSILGSVKRGNLLGRKLGFPTANIDPHHEVIPPAGVYAVRVILRKNKFNGVCNIGSRPTFNCSLPDAR
ncbi:MAG: riboflavin biosynthesis protein RibF, partial [Candidatus Omnitrophica bacterium]|nr:riboflavin biosynthesis protein RibF [Candidatus Omnitrophota bacterium]